MRWRATAWLVSFALPLPWMACASGAQQPAPASALAASSDGKPGAGVAQPEADGDTTPKAVQSEEQPIDVPMGAFALSGELQRLKAGEPVAFYLRTDKVQLMLDYVAALHPEARRRDEGVVLGVGALPQAVAERHRTASFLVDADEKVIVDLAAQLQGPATPAKVRELVASHFEKVVYGVFWTASRAAKLRAGDCTEHAVVSAAVARALGLPSRLVLGYVMLTDGEQGLAVGHAWAQVHDGTRWQTVDATPVGGEQPQYMIVGEIENEGPSHGRDMINIWAVLRASAIEILPPAALEP